ncbi:MULTISPECIES: MFS transporter [Pandoraea]|uniref:Major facilitator superfamily transporter n=1 Tax=Pandoraea communis TaxID=2508297 RepID=A0A5E4XA68_9BURK|nr:MULTISPECIES: MFS transporter [Pandoraea]EON11055.1 major facilitator superfamily transporter [Pandoraea sp. SD6-2]VVE33214.1 major facilitator superfamily transporter [Pandoraea communis]
MTTNTTNFTAPGWRDLLSGSNGWRSLALAGGVALHATNVYVATTVLPSIVKEIGGLDLYSWNTTLFVVASILGSVLASKMLTALGPRPAYVAALLGFSAGTILCAAAPSMPWMLAGRTLQGFGGGILLALSYALIRIVFAPALWSRAMGLVSGMWGVATLCGPAVGGVFAQFGHWRWAFWSLLPVVVGLGLIIRAQVPAGRTVASESESSPSHGDAHVIPWFKVVLLCASAVAISLGAVVGSYLLAAIWMLVGLVFAWWLAQRERSARHALPRLMPTGAYSLRTRLGGLYAVMSLLGLAMTSEIYIPYFLQTIHAQTPFTAGYLAALMAAGWSVGAMTSAGRHGDAAERRVRLGPVIVALGMLALAWLLPQPSLFASAAGVASICVALFGVGVGVGIGWPHLLTRVMTAARPGEAALASASITTVQLYSMALGSALAGLVANSAGLAQGALDEAQRASVWLFALFALAPAGAAVITLRGRVAVPVTKQEAA